MTSFVTSLPSRTQLFFLLLITGLLCVLMVSHLTNAHSPQKQADTKTINLKEKDNVGSEPAHWLVGWSVFSSGKDFILLANCILGVDSLPR